MIDPEILHPELVFKAVRSSGKGGQNVNKVASKVELYFDIRNSLKLDEAEKIRLAEKLGNRISNEWVLLVDSQESRSQLENKKIALKKFDTIILKALTEKKKRIASKPGAAAKAKRLDQKRKTALKKQQRSKIMDD
ncbi:MAG TPA: alternative ribosome rescue aminoacyl-tRNA hydrolase ArfB [Chitinophagales bacterium]|nr:alternative ribosome rescue aminoacyl-tRNA hydrolase ArfB [Chitinophagales bacterium]